MKPLLSLRDVQMSYARRQTENPTYDVLTGISLDVFPGEKLGLVGRNGAGKSTLLRIMAGIYAPSAGSLTHKPGIRIALLSLGLGFKDDLSGRDNAFLAGMLQGLSRRQARAKLVAIEEFCELGSFFDEPVRSYSSGMRARLGFATALLNDADILLIDETLSVGDQAFRVKARAALQEQLAQDRAAVLVSHNDYQIKTVCSRAVCLHEGTIVSEGLPEAVLAEYSGLITPH